MKEYPENISSVPRLPLVDLSEPHEWTESKRRSVNKLISAYISHVRQPGLSPTECLVTYTRSLPHVDRMTRGVRDHSTLVYRRTKKGHYSESVPLITERSSVFLANSLRRIGGKVIATNELLGIGVSLGQELSIVDMATHPDVEDYLYSYRLTLDQLEQVAPDRMTELENLLQD